MSTAASAATFPPHLVNRAIGTAMLVILLGALDQTIVTVAVPTMAHELGDIGWMAWVVSSYLVAGTVVTPLYGRFGDQHGRRRALLLAVLLFGLASAACAMAQTMPQLVWARVAQGIGGGGLLAGAQALIGEVVPPRERGRYQGWIAGVWAFANIAGPVFGGVLTRHLSWHWIFWINLPLCLLALWLVHDGLAPLNRRGAQARFDVAGSVWLVLGLIAVMLPVTRIGQGVSWLDPLNTGVLLLSVPLLWAFVRHEARTEAPILPLPLLRNPTVAACAVLGFLVYVVMITQAVTVPLRAQWVDQLSVDASAVRLFSMSMGVPVAASLSGRYMHRQARLTPLLRGGAVLVCAALLALAAMPSDWPSWMQMPLLFVLGLGFGLQLPASLVALQHAVTPQNIGTATGLSGLARQLGGALGVALFGALLLALLRDVQPTGNANGQYAGLEALVAAMGQSGPGAIDPLALDRPFRAVLWGCWLVSLLALPVVARLPNIHLDDRRS